MEIQVPRVLDDSGKARLTARVISGKNCYQMYYSVPVEYADWLVTDRCDGLVVGLLFQAMQRNEDIVVDGSLSSRLFHSLQNFFIPMMARAFPNLHPIKILPSTLTDRRVGGVGVATGLSGGIDSFAAVVQHLVQETFPSHRVTHFLFHNVGSHSHGIPEDARRLFRQRFQRVQPLARELGIPLVPVDSNVAEIFPVDFTKTYIALNGSVPLILQNQFQRYFYASSYKYADCGVNQTDIVGRFDPLAFHLLSTECLDCVSTGGQMSRVEKTQLVATCEPSHRYLNVCIDPAFEGGNCSVCIKCCRTLLTLELLGLTKFYRDVFDLERFSRVRTRYIMKVLRSKRGSFEAEIAELVQEKGRGLLPSAFWLRSLWERLVRQL